ncbi:iron ABC transporter permease [Marinomonas sp. UCMA 3892]|uniref:FecCD family ABC transporter permease n=1 Tax=Marinomonas sp. UCMA 3892 TaxID=1972585 RepID=UPI00146C3F36|nr:iron ABC transporter permease [Marinomonas sp. UCMA 3892]NLU99028.1 iron ABC transporter permease [Marinomonas sp. UCMA 3892]
MSIRLTPTFCLGLLLPILALCMLNGSIDTLPLFMEQQQRQLMMQIITELRLPRVIVAALVGAGLGMAGLLLQTLSGNRLADPSIIGVNQGAALAVVLGILIMPEMPPQWLPLLGVAGGLTSVIALWRLCRGTPPIALILMGVGLSSLLGALIGCLLILSETQQLAMVMTWLSGSFASTNHSTLVSTLVWSSVLLPASWLLCQRLGPLLLDPLSSRMLGARTGAIEGLCLLMACALGAVAVAASGTLGFVGLLAPHLARLLHPPHPERLALPVLIYGALLTMLADLLGRSLFAPVQLPAGLMLAMLGVPVFILLLLWQQRIRG